MSGTRDVDESTQELPTLGARMELLDQRLRLHAERLNDSDIRLLRVETLIRSFQDLARLARGAVLLLDQIAGLDRKEPSS